MNDNKLWRLGFSCDIDEDEWMVDNGELGLLNDACEDSHTFALGDSESRTTPM